MFNTATGINTVHVPYKGTAPAENGLIAGEIDYMVDPPTALPFVEAGRMKALAVASPTRSPALPNVPTLDEVGIPNVHTSTWYGFLAPAGTPKPIVDRLNREINAVLKIAGDPGAPPEERRAELRLDARAIHASSQGKSSSATRKWSACRAPSRWINGPHARRSTPLAAPRGGAIRARERPFPRMATAT